MTSHLQLATNAVMLVLAATLTAACGGRTSAPGPVTDGEAAGASWSGHLLSRGNLLISGNGVIMPSGEDNEMVVVISLQGPPSVSVALGWRLERGLCSSPGILVGRPGDYPPVIIRADGTGESTATVAEPVPTGGTFSIRVFSSQSPGSALLACGDLSMG